MKFTVVLSAVLTVVGALLAGAAWALSSPVGSSPDENYHLASIWCASGYEASDCEQAEVSDEGLSQVRVPPLVGAGACYAFHNDISGSCQGDIDKQGSVVTSMVDRGDYPGGFYRVMHLFVGDEVGESVVAMRLANLVLAVALLAVIVLSAPTAIRRVQIYTLTCLLVPLGWFMIASVNPSGWAVTGVTAYGFGLSVLFASRRRGPMVAGGVAAAVGAVLGISARGDAAVYVVLVTAALGIFHWRALVARRRLVIVPAICCAVSVWTALTAGQVAGAAQAELLTSRSRTDVIVQLALEFPNLVTGIVGSGFGLGWLDTPLPSVTATSGVMVLGYLVIAGAGLGGRARALAVLLLGSAMLAIPLLALYRVRMVVGEGIQPRYILPIALVLMALLLAGPRPTEGLRLSGVQAWIIWVVVTVANSAALYTNIRRYVTGLDGPVLLDATEWWWSSGPGPVTVWAVGSVGFAVFAFAIVSASVRVVWPARHRRRSKVLPRTSESSTEKELA